VHTDVDWINDEVNILKGEEKFRGLKFGGCPANFPVKEFL